MRTDLSDRTACETDGPARPQRGRPTVARGRAACLWRPCLALRANARKHARGRTHTDENGSVASDSSLAATRSCRSHRAQRGENSSSAHAYSTPAHCRITSRSRRTRHTRATRLACYPTPRQPPVPMRTHSTLRPVRIPVVRALPRPSNLPGRSAGGKSRSRAVPISLAIDRAPNSWESDLLGHGTVRSGLSKRHIMVFGCD